MPFEYWDTTTDEGLTDYDLEQRWDEWLDEVYGEVKIAGGTYQTSRVLKEVDEVAYRTGYNDWLDSALKDDQITDQEPDGDDEPDEDSITTEDHIHFYQYGKLAFTLGEDEDTNEGIRRELDKLVMWPNVFFISDHGNAHLIHYLGD